MKLHSIAFEDIFVEENRQRDTISAESLLELAGSISSVGLIHPIVVREDQGQTILVAGERRLRAMEYVWNFGQSVKCGQQTFPPNIVPCLMVGEIDLVTAYEIELEENIRRQDLTWQQRSRSTARLAELKEQIDGVVPTPAKLAEDLGHSVQPDSTASGGGGGAAQAVRQDLILSKFLADPDIAKAPTRAEAFKILKRKEETAKNAELGRTIEKTLAGEHRLLKGNCLEILASLPEASFDVILTDPPYGMNAQEFGNSQGIGGAIGAHFYQDGSDYFNEWAPKWIEAIKRVSKSQCHLYWFCDIDWFAWLKEEWADTEWEVFRTPLIWFNPGGSRAPWPERGPQRKSQYILYACKGKRPVTAIYGDVISCSSDANLGHPAQKPVSLYSDLLKRSIRPGDSVLDPFCGSGPIFPAAHALKCRATGIEQDEAACGIAAKRMASLK